MSSLLGTLTVLISASTVGFAKAAKDIRMVDRAANASTAGITAGARNANAALMSVGRTMTQFITLPLGILDIAATKTFSDFEYNIAKINGLVGISIQQTDEWAKAIQDMSASVGKGPVELSDALYFITSSGIKGAEAMEVLRTSAKAATAGLGETKATADIITSAMNAYGKSNLTAAQAGDILVNTVREGKAEADKMVASMGVVLPISSKLGVSFDQVGAALAAMTRTGSTASTSAVQLRQIMFTLLKPAHQTEEVLKNMGTSSAELRKKLREEGLLSALMEIKRLIDTYGEGVAGRILPNVRALSGTLEIIGANLEDNKEIFESLANSTGMLDNAFASVSDTLKIVAKTTFAEGSVMLTKFGEGISKVLIPVLKQLQVLFKEAGDWFAGLSDGQQKFIVKATGLAIALGPVISILSVLRATVLPGLIALYNGLARVLGPLNQSFSIYASGVTKAASASTIAASATRAQKIEAVLLHNAQKARIVSDNAVTVSTNAKAAAEVRAAAITKEAAFAQVRAEVAAFKYAKAQMVAGNASIISSKASELATRTQMAHVVATTQAQKVAKEAALAATAANTAALEAQRRYALAQRAGVFVGKAQADMIAAQTAATTANAVAAQKAAEAAQVGTLKYRAMAFAKKAEASATMTAAEASQADALAKYKQDRATILATAAARANTAAMEAQAIATKQAALQSSTFYAYSGGSFLKNSKLMTGAAVQAGNLTYAATGAAAAVGNVGKAANVASKSMTGFNAVAMAARANPLTSVLLLAGAIWLLARRSQELTEAQKLQKKVTDATAEGIAYEKGQLESYLAIAKNEYATKDMRSKAIQKINDLSPEYLGNITAETLNTNQAKDALDAFNASLYQRMQYSVMQSTLTDLETEYIQAVINGSNKAVTAWQKFKMVVENPFNIDAFFDNLMGKGEEWQKLVAIIGEENAKLFEQKYKQNKDRLTEGLKDRSFAIKDLQAGYIMLQASVEKTAKDELTFQEQLKTKTKENAKVVEQAGQKQQAQIKATINSLQDYLGKVELEQSIIKKGITSRPEFQADFTRLDSLSGKARIEMQKIFDKKVQVEMDKNPLVVQLTEMAAYYTAEIEKLNKLVIEPKIPTDFDFDIKKLFDDIQKEIQALERRKKLFGGKIVDGKVLYDDVQFATDAFGVYKKALESVADATDFNINVFNKMVQTMQVNYGVYDAMISTFKEMEVTTDRTISQFEAQMEVEYQATSQTEDLIQALSTAAAMASTFDMSLQGLTNSSYDTKVELEQLEKEIKMLEKQKGLLAGLKLPDLSKTPTMIGMIPYFQPMSGVDALDNLKEKFNNFTVNDVLKEMTQLLDANAEKTKILGDMWDGTGQAISIYENAISRLHKLDPTKITNVQDLEQYIALLRQASTELQKYQTQQMVAQQVGQAIADVTMMMGTLLVTWENGWGSMVDVVLQSAQQIISQLLAIAMAQYIMKTAPFPGGLIIAGIAISAMLALWKKSQAQANSSARMATGGVVPPGYPNDTYNARLTSGEMVIPPKKLPELANMNNKEKQEVVFIIEGRVLKGIMQDAQKVGRAY